MAKFRIVHLPPGEKSNKNMVRVKGFHGLCLWDLGPDKAQPASRVRSRSGAGMNPPRRGRHHTEAFGATTSDV
jgi:hypothetical protein